MLVCRGTETRASKECLVTLQDTWGGLFALLRADHGVLAGQFLENMTGEVASGQTAAADAHSLSPG